MSTPSTNKTTPKPQQTYNRNASSITKSTTTTVSIPAGVAGVVVNFDIGVRPIFSLSGADLGGVGNTSLVLGSSATFDTLVNPKADADLANGEYYVDHLTGQARGKKKDSGTSVSATVSYAAALIAWLEAIRGEDDIYNVLKTQRRGTKSVPLTASGLVFTGPGQLLGFVINSCGAGATLKIWDSLTGATTVAFDTMTFTAAEAQGPRVVQLPGDTQFDTGCYFTISGTMSVTPIFNIPA